MSDTPSTGEVSTQALAPKKEAFLSAFRLMGNITSAAIAARVHPDTPRSHWMKDAEFAKAFSDAKEQAADHMEQEARRRAVEGVQRLKFHQGELITLPAQPNEPGAFMVGEGESASWRKPYVEHEYSDTLLIFLLKATRPERFRDNVNLSGSVVHSHAVVVKGVDMEKL